MSRLQLPSSSGLRIDGRRPNECRRISMEMGVFHRAVNGSCRFQIGQTVAIAAVSGPAEAERWGHTRHDRAILNIEFYVSKFSASEHLRSTKGDRKSLIMEATLRQVFESVLQLHLYPRSEITVMVELVQNDGGVLPACINAITLALIDAGIPVQDFVCASSAGYIDSSPVLDLSWVERSMNGIEATVAILPVSGKLSLVEMECTIAADQLDTIVETAVSGCHQIHALMRSYIRKHAFSLIQKDDAKREPL